MHVQVDDNICIGIGVCVESEPDAFRLGDDGVAHVLPGKALPRDRAERVCRGCPSGAISIVEVDGAILRGRGAALMEIGRDDVVVVGNGVSGYACAKRLGEHGRRTVMIGPGLPHDRPPLSKHGLRTGVLPILADAASLADQGIVHIDGVVRALDLGATSARHRRRRRRARLALGGWAARLGDRPRVHASSRFRASSARTRTRPARRFGGSAAGSAPHGAC